MMAKRGRNNHCAGHARCTLTCKQYHHTCSKMYTHGHDTRPRSVSLQCSLKTPTSANGQTPFKTNHSADTKMLSDMGEMGYLLLRVHSLVNLDDGISSQHKPNTNRALFSAELVTSDYSRKKSVFTNGDLTQSAAWGDGLYFRIFQVSRKEKCDDCLCMLILIK